MSYILRDINYYINMIHLFIVGRLWFVINQMLMQNEIQLHCLCNMFKIIGTSELRNLAVHGNFHAFLVRLITQFILTYSETTSHGPFTSKTVSWVKINVFCKQICPKFRKFAGQRLFGPKMGDSLYIKVSVELWCVSNCSDRLNQ